MNFATSTAEKGGVDAADTRLPVTNLIYNHGNPYQRMMYADPAGPVRLEAGNKGLIGRLSQAPVSERPPVVHLHWDDRMFGRGADQAENRKNAKTILEDLAIYKADGGKIVWTVHNRIAHAARDSETFFDARRRIAGLADLIHVHAAHAAAHVTDAYDAPSEKLRIIPHPSYLGAYEDADATLGRPAADGATHFLHFGFIRTNKGANDVVSSAQALSGRDMPPWRLSIIGRAFRGGIRLMRNAAQIPNVTASTEPAPDEEIPAIFGAAHFYLAPVTELFTSGSLMLAQSYGLPILGPNIPEMRETTAPECHDLLYPSDGHPRRLLRAMVQAIEMEEDERQARRDACFAFAKARSPQAMSRLMSSAIHSVL